MKEERKKATQLICNKWKEETYRKTRYAKNAHRLYTQEQNLMILERRYDDATLAKMFGRSYESIQLQRCRIKKKLIERIKNGECN